ncbi:MAG: hypothetical protein IKK82_12470, partial [Kiritimatiellae bacterium]|nr:hypothetical protein [Kiritimatiellia bacterium]
EIDLVLTDFQKINFDGTPSEERFSFQYSADDAFTVDSLSHWDTCLMPAITYRTDRLRRMNYVQTEGVLYSDVEWSVTPLCVVRQVRYLPVRLYLYSMGREGQSMDAAVYHAHLADVVAVKKDLVAQIAGRNEYARDSNKILVRDVVLKSLQSLYLLFFLNYGTAEANRFLREFDGETKALDSNMYARLRALTLPGKKGFPYIRFWQDHRWADWLVRCIVHCYSPLAKILGKCLVRK